MSIYLHRETESDSIIEVIMYIILSQSEIQQAYTHNQR